jgi:1-acyl-sn-glycerol-3-phosphate acyltransferase
MPHSTAPLVADRRPTSASRGQIPLVRRVIKGVLRPYLQIYHRLHVYGLEHVPPTGPALVVVNHASLLDVPALMIVDPFPNTSPVVKASMFKVPVVRWVLKQYQALPVERQGRDSSSVRGMIAHLRSGGVIALAAEGRRTRSGRLEAVNLVLARFVASANVPVIPVGISGSFEALPPGAIVPRPKPITVNIGNPFRLERGTDADTAAARIQQELAALLPPSMQPLPESVQRPPQSARSAQQPAKSGHSAQQASPSK